ncbi:IS66 family transposase [Exilibacterium tricleocarpae]|uniref:IS66 family transposase n=1 Tax=Exilibacterium tricleocarpae TaxID=2591008 RepID=UPI001C554DC7|nr:IS66 family transposase [Exilibacterium tricleocarpae]
MNKRQAAHEVTVEEAVMLLAEKDQEIRRQSLLLEDKSAVIDKKSEVIEAQKKRIELLEEYLRLERARLYGRSSEKSNPQGELFDEVELCCDDSPDSEAAPAPVADSSGKKGRKGLSKNLPRDQVHINLSEEEKAGAIDTFFTLVKEELDIEPAKARVIEYLQEKAVFVEQGSRQVKAAALPKHPLPKIVASIGLLAFVVVSKYADGLPLYRLEKILQRYGGEISRTSMANWVIKLALQLQPLINLMREQQLTYDYLNIDETRIKVLKEPDRSPTSDKWMWVTRGGPPDRPSILFDYNPSRGKEVPLRLLEGFEGYLQCDGYAGYDAVCERENRVQLGCFDHLRRKFTDAKKAAGSGSKNKVAKYDVALGKINKLYVIEREIKHLAIEEKYRQRQARSKPVLHDIKQWLDKNIGKVPKDSKTHIAIQYGVNQWPKLIRYCDDGRLNISNAAAENAIRPFVIGRKGWLFADTPNGAKASAIHYSLIESAKVNGLEPYHYLKEVLKKLPYAETVEDLEALLSWNMMKNQ